LPLLGVTYVDLSRETKIQETVYVLLTQQYELAKVQEAKEIPTVKEEARGRKSLQMIVVNTFGRNGISMKGSLKLSRI
jgi:hypothetical protein